MTYRYKSKCKRKTWQKQVVKWLGAILILEIAAVILHLAFSKIEIRTEAVIKLSSLGVHVAYAKELSVEEQIEARIHEVFGDRGNDAIKMLKTCENKPFDPKAVSPLNGNGSVDVGLFQVNADPKNTEEVERLKDWEYNIQRAHKKFEAKERTFYYWTCGHVVGDYTYVDYLKGRK